MGPVYSSGINGGLQEKLASAADLVTLNMVLDHSRINLPLTNKANDAHPKRCPLEEIHLSISFHLFDSFFFFLCTLIGLVSCSHTDVSTIIFAPFFFCLFVYSHFHRQIFYPPQYFTLYHSLLLSFNPVFSPRSPTVLGPRDRRTHWCSAGSQAWSMDTKRKRTEETLTEQTEGGRKEEG